MGVWLKRRLDAGELEQAEFRVLEGAMGGRRIEIGCVACGAVSDLPDTHKVSPSGCVSPIWACPSESCPCVDWILLQDVNEEVLP